MRVLIVGLGSIAKKHIHALKILDDSVELFALRSSVNSEEHDGVQDIYDFSSLPDNLNFAIVATPTSEHVSSLRQLIPYKIPLFIEKPPVASVEEGVRINVELQQQRILNYVAFNLRFHPVIEWLKKSITSLRIYEVQIHCGSYLPDWRPGIDYRKVYSAQSALGGGVHLDLIHEIDYATWLFGFPDRFKSTRRKISDLEIDSYDYANYILEYESMVISIGLNYYRRDSTRTITVVHSTGTWIADLINGSVKSHDGEILFSSQWAINSTYEKQMRYFIDCLMQGKPPMNNFQDAIKTLEICLK